jgi:hypothetical protein
MKQTFTLIFLSFFIFHVNAQVTFSDDFESYNNGDYLAASSSDWKTWNSSPGSASDCQVTNEQSSSGSKALKIFGSNPSGGGPMDLLLPFNKIYNSGQFVYSMNLMIPKNKNAHFNMQAGQIQGQLWALNGNFKSNGIFEITDKDNNVLFTARYQSDTWFNFELDINLTSNVWKVSLGNECLGSFTNTVNKVSYISYYALNDDTEYFMDDVAYSHDENVTTIQNDVGISNMTYNGGRLEGISQDISFIISNNGLDTITYLEFELSNNNELKTEVLSNIRIDPGSQTKYTTSNKITVGEGLNQIEARATKINDESGDDNDCNNTNRVLVETIKPALYKYVLIEEGTGTWCPWCVRGTVFMDRLSHAYEEYFIPVAVHNGDPMVVDEYDTFIGNWPDFGGYPNVVIARQNATGFGVIEDMEDPFLNEVVKAAPLFLSAGAEYDANTGLMNIEAFVTFLWDSDDDYHLNLILTEDNVTGTSSGYAQSNAYAGGAQGPMGGYELLPTPVPGSQMVYDHVARAVYGLTPSATNTITGPFTEGQIVAVSFTHQMDPSHNIDNMYIIPVANKGNKFINAREVHVSDALSRGITSVKSVSQKLNTVKVYPNPTSEVSNFDITLDKPSEVIIELIDATGKVIASANHGKLSGTFTIPVNVKALANGIYVARIITDEGTSLNRIVVEN